ncbi:MAG: MFS transporter [Anaerolineae bacterium]|nr:MFS transporter [Thermoflexales bacterium]MDW8395205.1 MFS transporter [Anaerolineae bacterium]
MERLSLGHLIALTSPTLGLYLCISILDPALIGNRLFAIEPRAEARAATFGALTFAGLVVASVTQPLIGSWSDRARSRWGRRLPFVIAGACIAVGGLALVASATSLLVLGLGVVTVQFGLNVALAGWQPLLAEGVNQEQRGTAASLRAGSELLAASGGRLFAGEVIAAVGVLGVWAFAGLVALPAAVLIVTLPLAAPLIVARSSTKHADLPSARLSWRSLFEVNLRAHPAFGWWFLNRVCFWCGLIGSSAFLLFVGVDVLGLSESEAQRFVSRLIVLLGVALAAVILPAGWLADRIGRQPIMIAAGILASSGAGLVLFNQQAILPAALLIGAASGLYIASSLALLNDIVPREETARYLGIANVATAGSSALARLGGGALISGVNALLQTRVEGYLALYAVAAVLFAVSALIVLKIKRNIMA